MKIISLLILVGALSSCMCSFKHDTEFGVKSGFRLQEEGTVAPQAQPAKK